jgi:hypothetical protein
MFDEVFGYLDLSGVRPPAGLQPDTVRFLHQAVQKGYGVRKNGQPFGPSGNIEGWLKLRRRGSEDYYRVITVYDDAAKKPRQVYVHHLQAYQKYGTAVVGKVARHKNGESQDNRYDNIVLGTVRQNMMDIPSWERLKKAKKAAGAKRRFTSAEVRELRRRWRGGAKVMHLAAEKGVSKGLMSDLLRGRTYKDVK